MKAAGTDIELFITTVSNTPADVTLTTPRLDPDWQKTVTVSRGHIAKVKVPHFIRGAGVEKAGKGLWIQATEEVSVYAVNKETYSTDAFLAFPTDVLGTQYYAVTFRQDAELMVIATHDDTRVSITWPTGAGPTRVTYDNVTYGFVTFSTPERGRGDIYRFVASEDDTTVGMSNGQQLHIANAGHFEELDIPSGDYRTVTSDKPLLAVIFAKTFMDDGPTRGDPAMTYIIPVEQYASDYTWSTVKTPENWDFNNKLTVIIHENLMDGLWIDYLPIEWEELAPIPGSDGLMHLWTHVKPGSHNIFHSDPSVTFMAIAAGTEAFNSYSYPAGLRMALINAICRPSTSVAGDVVDNDCDGLIDEETLNGIDDDGDGLVDEDLATPPRALNSQSVVLVQALNELTSHGLYYVRSAKIVVRFVKYDEDEKPIYKSGITVFSITQEDIRQAGGKDPWKKRAVIANGVSLTPTWDGNDNFAIFTIDQCNVRVQFRPYVPDQLPQIQKPAVSVVVPADAEFRSSRAQSVCQLAGDGEDVFTDQADDLNLRNPAQDVIYNILNDKDLTQNEDNPDYGHACNALSDVMSECDVEKHALAIRLCTPILNRKSFLHCLMAGDVDVVEAARRCMSWVCFSSTADCNLYLADMATNNCTTTHLMDWVGCDVTRLETELANLK
nr:hypothetical protein BaRGS_029246 [Batillaria attramentaria]